MITRTASSFGPSSMTRRIRRKVTLVCGIGGVAVRGALVVTDHHQRSAP